MFIDETAVKTNLTRLRGRGLVGERLYGTALFGTWGTQTFIAGLTQNALIAPRVITGAPLVHVNMRVLPPYSPDLNPPSR